MPSLLQYGAFSSFLLAWAVFGAFRMRPNFFSAAVYLSKSNACMLIMWNYGLFCTVVIGKGMQKLFFGQLRTIEIERLNERAWFAVTETLLALTIFREEFDTSFVALFISLLFVKAFHWLASDRIEFMEQTTEVSLWFHARMVGCLATLWIADILLLLFAAESILIDGPSVMIMFASEYLVLIATVWAMTAKYGINVYDSRRENWEGKSLIVFYVELVADFMKLCVYIAFFSLILTFYGLPLNTLRDLYMTARSFVLKCRDLVRYKQATRNMDEKYPNATHDEMNRLNDKTCIICREDMEVRDPDAPAPQPPQQTNGPNETPKKLPCGHIFHFHCLRSWLERQQSCPTCRHSVLQSEPPRPPGAGAAAAAGARPAAQAGAGAQAGANGDGDHARFRQLIEVMRGPPPPAARPAQAPNAPAAANVTASSSSEPRVTAPAMSRRGTPAQPTGARDSNPLVRFKTPLPVAESGSNSRIPYSPAPGFPDALRQHYSGSSRPAPTPQSSMSSMGPSAKPRNPSSSSTAPMERVAPIASTSSEVTNGVLSAEEEATRQRRERAAAAAARRIPRLSPPRPSAMVDTNAPRPSMVRRTASESSAPSFLPAEPAAGQGILPSMPRASNSPPPMEEAVHASDLPRLIPLFNVADLVPHFTDGLPSLASLLPRADHGPVSVAELMPILQTAQHSLDRCRAEVEACLQRIAGATSTIPLVDVADAGTVPFSIGRDGRIDDEGHEPLEVMRASRADSSAEQELASV